MLKGLFLFKLFFDVEDDFAVAAGAVFSEPVEERFGGDVVAH